MTTVNGASGRLATASTELMISPAYKTNDDPGKSPTTSISARLTAMGNTKLEGLSEQA
jgi:hypothetical protein